MRQQGFINIPFLAILLIAALGGISYYFGYDIGFEKSTKNVETSPSPTIQVSPTPTTDETNGFPIYPEVKSATKRELNPCSQDRPGYQQCGTSLYIWETKDDYDTVSTWFSEDKSQSGWKCAGGAGQYDNPRDASGVTNCTKQNLTYRLFITSTQEKTTIELELP